MRAAFLIFALLSPAKKHRCTTGCWDGARDMFHGWICYYDEELVCPRTRPECIDSDTTLCVPRVVDLGPSEGTPIDYR